MSFTDRERDFENRYVHDQELKFRVKARGNKLLGLWAADKLGKTGDDANAYAQLVIRADFELPGEDDVFHKIRKDFDAAGVSMSDTDIHAKMAECLLEAEKQVMSE